VLIAEEEMRNENVWQKKKMMVLHLEVVGVGGNLDLDSEWRMEMVVGNEDMGSAGGRLRDRLLVGRLGDHLYSRLSPSLRGCVMQTALM
jgi:hypothetical protein